MIAMIHGINAFTSPRPIPSIVTRISPAHATRSVKANPVVASNSAVDVAMRLSIFVYILFFDKSDQSYYSSFMRVHGDGLNTYLRIYPNKRVLMTFEEQIHAPKPIEHYSKCHYK